VNPDKEMFQVLNLKPRASFKNGDGVKVKFEQIPSAM
jgi:biotin synthase